MSLVDISMFSTDELKLTLFFAMLQNTVNTTKFIQLDPSLAQYTDMLEAIKGGRIDRFNGRSIKSDISGDVFDTGLFNRDNGYNAGERIVNKLKADLGL